MQSASKTKLTFHIDVVVRMWHTFFSSAGNMKNNPSYVHGIWDYSSGFILIFSPWLFAFNNHCTAQSVPIMLGSFILLYSSFTNYEWGVVKFLPFKIHLLIDVSVGLFMGASPWLLDFAHQVWVPHAILGVIEIVSVALTRLAVSRRMTTSVLR